MLKIKPVKIIWIDSQISSSWQNLREFSSKKIKDLYIESTGYLIKKTKYSIIIAQSQDRNNNFSNLSEIPRCSIVRIKKYDY